VFAQHPGGNPPTPQAARADFRRLRQQAHLAKPITPHPLCHTYATHLLNAGAERENMQALLGHFNQATTPIDTHVDQDRMAAVVNKL
jgi:site-specific recombinase XerD